VVAKDTYLANWGNILISLIDPGSANSQPLNPNVPVTRQTPPTFSVQAEDDSVDGVNQSVAYYIALKKAGVPVQMHLYAQGGHAFGLRLSELPITGWPRLMGTSLATIGMASE